MQEAGLNSLEVILERYYRVQGRPFSECTPIQVWKHQVLHLAKLTKKLMIYVHQPTEENRDRVCREVLPDLLIYTQELMLKSGDDSQEQFAASCESALLFSTLGLKHHFRTVQDSLLAIGVGVAALADICDQSDHGQPSRFRVERDVVPAFLKVAATLQELLNVDVAYVYEKRLQNMQSKYEGWSVAGRQGGSSS